MGSNKQFDDVMEFLSTSPWSFYPGLINSNNETNYIWEKYLHLAEEKKIKKGTYVVLASDVLDKAYYVKKGIIQCSMIGVNGLEKVTHVLGAGCIIGENAIFHNQPILYNARAITNAEVCVFAKDVIYDLIKNDSEISFSIINSISLKCRLYASQIEDLSFRTTLEKLCRVLYCFSYYEELHKQDIVLTHQELATIVNAHRVSVTKALAELKENDIISCSNGKIFILDKIRLREIGFNN